MKPLLDILGVANDDRAGFDSEHCRAQACGYLSCGDAVFDVRLDPVLDALRKRSSAIHQRNARTGTKQLQRSLDGRVASADNDDIESEAQMRLVEVVGHERGRFARHIHQIRLSEIPCCENQPFAVDGTLSSWSLEGARDDVAGPVGVDQSGVGSHSQLIGAHDSAIVFEGFFACRLLSDRDERMPPDLEELGSGEESHADGIPDYRIGDGAGFDYERIYSAPPCREGASQSDGTAADDYCVFEFFVHWSHLSYNGAKTAAIIHDAV